MDIDISQCPEDSNSTDCLLRTLLQLLKVYREADNAAIDWDPISFAFTLLIGLVAILFALATVTQAISAAGKGRRRTSHLAIGKWNVETKREWDWSEMNFRYIATTPILHEKSLLSLLESHNKTERSTDKQAIRKAAQKVEVKFRASIKSIASCFHPNRDQSSEPRPNQSRKPSAAWLEFFKEVGLDDLSAEAWGTNKRKVVADYLPDDITAAPAYAQVGAIVAAAVMAGIQEVEIDKQVSRNYPILLGQGFQVDFRQHPALGVVGAYSRYDETSKEPRRLNVEELNSAIKNGRGFVDDQETIDLSTELTRRQLIERWVRLGVAHATTCELWSATLALNSSAISEAHIPLIIGMFANRPKYAPVLFPTATMSSNNCLTTLALSGKYWAEVHLDKFREPDRSSWWQFKKTPIWDGFHWPRGINWERTMSSKVRKLYHKLETWRSVPIHPWRLDIMEGQEAIINAALARLQPREERLSKLPRVIFQTLQATVTEQFTRMRAERGERGRSEKAHSEESKAQTPKTSQLQVEEEQTATTSRIKLEEEESAAKAAARLHAKENERAAGAEALRATEREAPIAETRPPIKNRATNSDDLAKFAQPGTEAKTTIGQGLVLQTCLELLHEPVLLEQWFSKAPSDSLIFLRSLVHEQIQDVDEWLQSKLRDEGIRHRSILLCNTTIALLLVEQMIGNDFFNSSGQEEPQGHGGQGGSVEQQPMDRSARGRPEQGIASRTHFRILQVLRNMVDGVHKKGRDASELENLLHVRSDPSLLWDRFKALLVYHSKDEPDSPLWDQFKHEKYDNEARDIDDVIIYRCLMMILLFRTAVDSSKILDSGIWDQVVPII